MNSCTSRVTGSLLGGAIGDALGYPVKFTSLDDIERKYGTAGLPACLVPNPHTGFACFSDATQLTLFTAEGLIHAAKTEADPVKSVYRSYLRWLYTQDGGLVQSASTGLLAHAEMYVTRAPAATTLAALHSGAMGSVEMRINTSRAADAMMRTAPAGYVAGPREAQILGERIAALTHGHPDGYRAAGAFSALISLLVDGTALPDAAAVVVEETAGLAWGTETATKLSDAIVLAEGDVPDTEAVAQLGTGKTAERALAIGVFCALRHEGSFPDTVRAAANHGGDSSVTASVAGQIAGASLGRGAVPEEWMRLLELSEMIDAYGMRIGSLRGML
ncbi:MAG: ADP-ribosylglycohydrolase family protein [Methanocorpusculum sp.]|nr:ADP-ribosylglycohydrolase family protein [Methanocorpusculum sp.]